MSSPTCSALTTLDTKWNFCPSLPAAYVFTVLFGLTLSAHIFQAIYYKKPYCVVIITSALAQTLCYIFRVLSILHPDSFADYASWFILILIAPLFTNAFVYMVMGRMIWNFTSNAKIYRISAWRAGTLFVVLDVLALVIQILGAASASGDNQTTDKVLRGLHIYMIGVGIQQLFIIGFIVFAIKFHRTYLAERKSGIIGGSGRSPLPLLYMIYFSLALITLRIVFRLTEYSQGLDSTIPNHEAYQYALDSLPMLVALILLNVIHPGRVMPGKDGNIPGRRERKRNGVYKKGEFVGSSSREEEMGVVSV